MKRAHTLLPGPLTGPLVPPVSFGSGMPIHTSLDGSPSSLAMQGYSPSLLE